MNKQQIYKFLKVGLSGVFTGFFIGFLASVINLLGFDLSSFDLSSFNTIFPNFIFVITIINFIILMIFSSIKGKIAKDNYSDEEDSQFAKYEKTLLVMQSLSTMLIMTNFLFITGKIQNLYLLVIFSLNIVLSGYLEVSHINLIKDVQPSKNADPTTFDYNDQALETLDEGELHTLGKVALKTMNKMVYVYVGFMILGFFTAQNFMFFIGVWGIYIAQSIIMMYYSLKLGDFKA